MQEYPWQTLHEAKMQAQELNRKQREHFSSLKDNIYGQEALMAHSELGRLHFEATVVDNAFNVWHNSRLQFSTPRYISGGFPTRDITQTHGGDNLYLYGSHSITPENISIERDIVVNRVLCFLISQSYEIFETFLINCYSRYLESNPEQIPQKLELQEGASYDQIRAKIKNKFKNHHDYLKIFYKLSEHFKKHRIKNTWDQDLVIYAKVLSLCRHDIVHGRLKMSSQLIEYTSNSTQKKMFEEIFHQHVIETHAMLQTDLYKAQRAIEKFAEMTAMIAASLDKISK